MAEAAVFALSSRYEGLPMVVLEAMDKQMAVVAYDCPTGPRELITDGVDGLLVAPEDVEALAAGLRKAHGRHAVTGSARRRSCGPGRSLRDLSDIGEQWTQLLAGRGG